MHVYDPKHKKQQFIDKKQVLTKAFIRVNDLLHFTRHELSGIVGLSEPTLSRVFANTSFIDPTTKEGESVILLIRLYQSLDALFGGNSNQCQLWLRNNNKHLNSIPIDLIQSTEGLVLTVQYLGAMRGKN